MKLSVKNLRDEPLLVTIDRETKWCRDILELAYKDTYQGDFVDFAHNMSGRLSIQRTLNQIDLSGSLSLGIRPHCDRCLEFFESQLSIPIRVTYVPHATINDDESDDGAGASGGQDLTVWPYKSDEIDLGTAIYETAVLAIPLHYICSESCRGLCPNCGINLNNERCTCETKRVNPRLAVLSEWKQK